MNKLNKETPADQDGYDQIGSDDELDFSDII